MTKLIQHLMAGSVVNYTAVVDFGFLTLGGVLKNSSLVQDQQTRKERGLFRFLAKKCFQHSPLLVSSLSRVHLCEQN